MGRLRRLSHDIARPRIDEAKIDELVAMGFPPRQAKHELEVADGDVRRAAENMVHAVHGAKDWDHPDCPVCVREKHVVEWAEGKGRRSSSLAAQLSRITSRGTETVDESPFEDGGDGAGATRNGQEAGSPPPARRGSVSAMLRRPSIAEALRRMKSREARD